MTLFSSGRYNSAIADSQLQNSQQLSTATANATESDLPGGQNPTVTALSPLSGAYNLAHDAPYTVTSIDNTDPAFHRIETKTFPGPPGGLTANSLVWTGFLRQAGRTIIVQLPKSATVTNLSIQFYQDTSMGILYPKNVTFSLSTDGNTWYAAGVATSTGSPNDSGKLIQTYQIAINQVAAQYVRVQFPVDVWSLARNLRVLGSPLLTPSTMQLPLAAQTANDLGYLLPSQQTTAGVHNMLLVYSGDYGAQGIWTTKQFLPMVAYTSPDGQIDGKMFDSFLFLPYGSLLKTASLWQGYLNNLFASGQQLSALNQTVAQLAPKLQSMGIQEPSVNVVLTIPYPNSSITNFGALPGITNSLSFSAAQVGKYTADANRKAAIEWYVQALLARWSQAHFTHLHLAGLYWDSESVNYTAPLELDLIHQGVQLAHNAGLKMFWIPSFEAPGLILWQDLGFDDVMVQSNYIETPTLPVSRVTETANEAYRDGLGIEVELSQNTLTSQSQRNRYFDQLVADNVAGAEGDVLHSFYDGSQVLTQAAYSSDPSIRDMYVQTYDFLIGQFTNRSYIGQ